VPSATTNEATRREWRDLGFFYERDDAAQVWTIRGSIDGLNRFAAEIERYASKPNHTVISEHDHFGPYLYLKIGTWPAPQLNGDWIAGPLSFLTDLAQEIRSRLNAAAVGQTLSLRGFFEPSESYDLLLKIEPDSFDPAEADAGCW
jgi:hypothetical protein